MVYKPNATQRHQLIIDADGGPSLAAPSQASLVIIHTLRNHEALTRLKRSQVTRFISRWKGPPSEWKQRCGIHMVNSWCASQKTCAACLRVELAPCVSIGVGETPRWPAVSAQHRNCTELRTAEKAGLSTSIVRRSLRT